MSITVRTRSNGKKSYLARVIVNTKQTYKTFRRKSDAEDWIHERKYKKSKGISEDFSKTDYFVDYAEHWINSIARFKEDRTIENYKAILNKYLVPFFHGKRLGEITYADGEGLQKSLLERDFINKTNNSIVTLLKQILKYATIGQGKRKQLQFTPLSGIEMLKIPEGQINYWEEKECSYFLRETSDDFYCDFYLTDLNTGLRIGELAGLTKSKILFDKNLIEVSGALKRKKGGGFKLGSTKNKLTRYVPMNSIIKSRLQKRCEKLSSNSLVFVNKKGRAISPSHFCNREFRPLQKKVGVKSELRFHDLRHTYASHFMMNGGGIFTLQKLLGHKDIKSTMIYAHLSPDYLQRAADLVQLSGGLE